MSSERTTRVMPVREGGLSQNGVELAVFVSTSASALVKCA
jgi:hypothetical protein